METPVLPQDKWFGTGKLRLHYLDWGNPGAVPMVLVHSLTGSAHYWDFFARSLRRDYHVVALDQRGHGDSSRAEKYGPREYVADLTGFMDALGLTGMVLIGHSLGGINAIVYAAEHPDRVSQLVIVDIGPEIAPSGAEEIRRIIASRPETFNSEEEVFRQIHKERPYHSEAFIRHLIKYTMRRDASGGIIYKYDPALRRVKISSSKWLWPFLRQVVCPTLVVRGADSNMLLPEAARKMVEALPFGATVVIERATHGVPGDNPEAFEAAVRQFLRDESQAGNN